MFENWLLLKRKKIYETKHAVLFSDDVQLPNGEIIKDYSVVSFPDGVVVVATDTDNNLIAITEYKYAIDKTILNLPSGTAEDGLEIKEIAKKELLEETGYTSDDIEIISEIYEYPSKLTHRLHIVRITNAHKVSRVDHETSEQIGQVLLLKSLNDTKLRFNTSYNITALALTLPKFIR